MLSERIQAYACECCAAALPSFGGLRARIEHDLSALEGDEATLMRLAYGTLPISDVGSVPFHVLYSYVRHALQLRENSPLCRDVPEEVFLHFVFYPRINSEDLVDCRPFLFGLLRERLEGLSALDAALEVNRWCAEQMTYQTTNDRTENPLTAYYCGLGRCGEESVFAVSAYRSVGIPARQIYVPRWSHCDDNHAWVEVYVDGQWHFLGACEPEPVLDRGWFTDASSRAPLEMFHTFFAYEGDGIEQADLVEKRGISCYYNVTDRYAETCALTLQVLDTENQPVPEARVALYVVNMASFEPVARGFTDENGFFSISMGRGTVHIEVSKDDCFAMGELPLEGETCSVALPLSPREALQGFCDVDFEAPLTTAKNKTALTAEQREENARVVQRCNDLRTRRIESYFRPEYAVGDAEVENILHLAGGNAHEIFRFYNNRSNAEKPLAKQLLLALESKDYRDITCGVLEAHFCAALEKGGRQEHFISEVMNPRIQYEMIEDWRAALEEAFTDAQKRAFAEQPALFMDYICANYPDGEGRYYPILTVRPCAALAMGCADEKGRRLLFVAGMRTFGVPARINPADGSAEYWRDGGYHSVVRKQEPERSCTVYLHPQEGKRFVYSGNYTLARWQGDRYETLDYSEASGEELINPFRIPVLSGEYRLTTTSRLPNGNQLCRVTYFVLEEGQSVELPLELREAAPEEMLANSKLEPFAVWDEQGEELASEDLLQPRQLVAYLEVGTEPTEHLLNEMLAAADKLNGEMAQDLGVALVLRGAQDLENRTLQEVLEKVPACRILYDYTETTATMLARKMFLEPGVRPLLVLMDDALRGYYGSCGYQVSVMDLALSLADCIGFEEDLTGEYEQDLPETFEEELPEEYGPEAFEAEEAEGSGDEAGEILLSGAEPQAEDEDTESNT